MNLQQLLLVLRARYGIALLVLLGTVAAALVGNEKLPKAYTATTSLVVDVRSRDPVAALFMPGNIATQVEIINSERVAMKVVRILGLGDHPERRQQWQKAGGSGTLDQWLSGLLRANLNVRPGRDGNIIHIDFKAADPSFAAAAANAFAQAYIDATVELKVEPAKQYSRWFEEQGKLLRESVEEAQSRLSRFQQQKGIVARDEALDTETARLAALTAQLTVIQEQNADARSKRRQGDARTLPEVMQSAVITGLRGDIARMEAKLKEASGNLGINHPQYVRMESELAEMKARLEAETRLVASGVSTSGAIGKDKEAEIRVSIEAQKKKLLELKGARDQLAVLQRDVDAAKQAYESVRTRFNQASLESQATQASVSVLNAATEPPAPSFPKPLQVILLLSVVAGTGLGIGAAFGVEMLDRRIRSADDLGEMLHVPVLGVIESAPARERLSSRRLLALR